MFLKRFTNKGIVRCTLPITFNVKLYTIGEKFGIIFPIIFVENFLGILSLTVSEDSRLLIPNLRVKTFIDIGIFVTMYI